MQKPTCETWKTDTLVGILAMGVTSASVQAGLGHVAEVRFWVLALLPRESWSTLASWFSYQGRSFTGSPVLAGVAFTGVSVLTVVPKKSFSTPARDKKWITVVPPEALLLWEDPRNEVPWAPKVLKFAISGGDTHKLKGWRHMCNRDFLWDCPKRDHWTLKCKWWNRSLQNKYHTQSELYQMQNLLYALPFKTSEKA